MKIDYDPKKNAWNIANRDLPFDLVEHVDWDTALIREDTRHDYPERRYIMLACLNGALHVTCFTPIKDGIRVISFRKANKPERRNYERQYHPC
ncbi:BrnT family toxin [Candidatus Thiothrix sp. Deng01]|uniref:BrnT family toxin n=1 Tax=Candidatus Thiothrix phosphatis TaxID=3112415 RepID=A0ABU6CUK5_9GAMM|nr:BrnT family toxin [Candidatus Thiothrix sp. Deng01]MEB4590516.1 BrnT family toxin [Candidatus Thiothrix sp. Deng01]